MAALVASLFVAAALAYVLTATKIYASNAVIFVPPKNDDAVFEGLKGGKAASWESLDALKSMAEGIQNGSVILRVDKKLKLRDNPDFLKPKEGGYTDGEIVAIIERRVYASLRRGTRIIDVLVKDKSPERAQQMTKAFLDEFQELIREQNLKTVNTAKKELEQQAESQLARVMEKEDLIQKFREEHAEMSLGETVGIRGTPEKKLDELDRLLSASMVELIARQSEYEQLQGISEDSPDEILDIGNYSSTQDSIQKLLTARSAAETEYYQTKSQFGSTNPSFLKAKNAFETLNTQVSNEALKVATTIKNSYAIATENEEQLKAKVREQKRHLLDVSKIRKEFTALNRAKEASYNTYQSLLDRVNQTDVTAGIDETVIRVFAEPMVSTKPVSPQKKVTVIMAGVFGSIIGMALIIAIGLM